MRGRLLMASVDVSRYLPASRVVKLVFRVPFLYHDRNIRLLLSFYSVAMLPFGATVSMALAWLAALVWLLGAKVLFGLLYGYLWLLPVHGRELSYYRNLGLCPGALLGGDVTVDMLLFAALVIFACTGIYPLGSDTTF